MDILFREFIGTIRWCRSPVLSGLSPLKSKRYTSSIVNTVQQNEKKEAPPLKVPDKISNSKPYGQPTPWTHPHRLLEGEIVPSIRIEEFKARRHRLLESIESFSFRRDLSRRTHLIVIPSSCKKYMTEKIPYIFRQNSDFLYLTGCLEPNSTLVLSSNGSGNHESTIFLRGRDAHSELWDGPRTGVNDAKHFFGIDKALPNAEFETYLTCFMQQHRDCVLWYDYISDVSPEIHRTMKEFLSHSWNKIWESPKPFIHRQRLYKSPAEQELMKKSCSIGSNAFRSIIGKTKPGDNEAHIFARIDYECRINGAEYLAYPPVVAGADRANIIHYINNDQLLKDKDMVLVDAGCEYHGYTSDITRTWPVSGKFSPAQRELYEVVYSVQTELIQMCSTFPTLDDLFNVMCKLLGVRLKDLGLLSNRVSATDDISRVAYAFCPHHVSHYLGMDVHDTSSIPRNIPIEPGMVITIEPGVYVSSTNKLANPLYHGLGIRIEDDVLITNNGPLVLTTACPKHPDDIEKLFTEKN